MGIQRSEITCKTEVYRFHAHSLSTFCLITEKKAFSWHIFGFFTVFEGFFDHNYALSQRMSTKPIYLCSSLNFGLLDNHGNLGGVGIVLLYKPETDNLNFHLCVGGCGPVLFRWIYHTFLLPALDFVLDI